MKTNGTAVQLSTLSLSQYSFNDVMSMGDIYFQSGLFKDIRSAAQAIVKIMKGRELNIPPASAMEIINVIEGKTALSGVAIAGIIKSSRKYRYDVVECTSRGATIEFFERLDGAWRSLGRTSFVEEDARRAGLAGKKNWREYPQNMYLWRALSNGGRMFCPDILAGVYTPEELGADVSDDGSVLRGEVAIEASETALEPHCDEVSLSVVSPIEPVQRPETASGAIDTALIKDMASESPGEAAKTVADIDASTASDPRPEWLREAAQHLRDHLSQQELMELRMMWRDAQYPREEIVERMRTLAKRYRVHIELREDD